MVWFLERDTELIICEIRQAADTAGYEFEIASSRSAPETSRFSCPAELIRGYLSKHTALRAQGWRPRIGDVGE